VLLCLCSFLARPLLSYDGQGADKHKMERFLQPGAGMVGSVYGPISYPPLPLLAFKVGLWGWGGSWCVFSSGVRVVQHPELLIEHYGRPMCVVCVRGRAVCVCVWGGGGVGGSIQGGTGDGVIGGGGGRGKGVEGGGRG